MNRLLSYLRRHRRLTLVLSLGFLAFELWRFSALTGFLAPIWRENAVLFEQMAARPPWIAATTFLFAAILIAVPMTALVFALRWLHRRLSRKWTIG